jgi:hypothetical protein
MFSSLHDRSLSSELIIYCGDRVSFIAFAVMQMQWASKHWDSLRIATRPLGTLFRIN